MAAKKSAEDIRVKVVDVYCYYCRCSFDVRSFLLPPASRTSRPETNVIQPIAFTKYTFVSLSGWITYIFPVSGEFRIRIWREGAERKFDDYIFVCECVSNRRRSTFYIFHDPTGNIPQCSDNNTKSIQLFILQGNCTIRLQQLNYVLLNIFCFKKNILITRGLLKYFILLKKKQY